MVPIQTVVEITSFGDCCGAYKFLIKFVILLGELVMEFFPQRIWCGEVFNRMTDVTIAEKEQRTLGISFGRVNGQRKCGYALRFIFILVVPSQVFFWSFVDATDVW